MSLKKSPNHSSIVTGTVILTLAGLVAKILSFVYRIILTRCISTEELGIYQVVQPLTGIIFSVCCVGFQSAVSKFTAGDKKNANLWLIGALIPSMALSSLALVLTNHFADIIASRFLLFSDAVMCVKMISWSFPFIALHNCLAGYYYGHRKTTIPAISQVAEQTARIATLFIVFCFLRKSEIDFLPHHAVIGNIAGEIASCASFVLTRKIYISSLKYSMKNILESMKKIFFYSLPISVGSLLIHLFQSAEAVLIPAQLIISGNSYSTALETYGILSGMAMPLISLPSVFTGSLAVMLIPSVADKNASSDETVKKTVTACLILGVFSVFVYGTFMADIASIMYDESRAGQYTKILSWLCPFMFLTQSMSSILNGAGKTTSTCVQNTLGIAIRLAALICLVPTYGINAYMISLLVSKLVVCIIQYVQIKHLFNLKINVGSQILKSAAYSGIATLSAYAAKMLLSALESSTNGIFSITADIIALGLSCAVFAALYFYFEKSKQTKSLLFP